MSKLAALLNMLASDFDGERANAAAMIARMVKTEGQRRMAESDARAKQIMDPAPRRAEGMEPVNALDAMADELDRELNKSA